MERRTLLAAGLAAGTLPKTTRRESSITRGDIVNLKKDFGCTGNGTTDEWSRINSALSEGHLYAPKGRYRITQPLIRRSSNFTFDAHPEAVIVYDGDETAIQYGTKSGGPAISGITHNIRVEAAGPAKIGVHLIGVQYSDINPRKIEGFNSRGAVGMLFDTQSVKGFAACINNNVWGGWIDDCRTGMKFIKDPADTGTDGCNHNTIYGTRISNFRSIGFDNDAGENNHYIGTDASTPFNNTTGHRINDDVCTLIGPRSDCSFDDNNSIGILFTRHGRSPVLLNPTGNGPSEMVVFENRFGRTVMRDGFDAWFGDINFRGDIDFRGRVNFSRMPTVDGTPINKIR